MNTKDSAAAALRQLKRSHKRIRDEFAEMDNSLIEELLAKQHTPQLHEQMKKHGDGQRLSSYPRSIRVLESTDAVALFAMNFPKLGSNSEFDRSTPLHEIDYWRTFVPIRPDIDSRKLHFMAWQQKTGMHGANDPQALSNYKLLTSRNHKLKSLLENEEEAGIRFVLALERWLSESGKSMIAITNSIKKNFDEPMLSLVQNPRVKRIETGLRSRNYRIMEKIGKALMGDD